MIVRRLLLDPTPTDGNGNNPAIDTEKVTIKSLLAKHNNDAQAALIELSPILANMSKTVGNLRDENQKLKAQVPAEGSIVVPADKAKLWEVVKDLQDDPKDVARRLKDFGAVEAELTGIKATARKTALAQVARVDGRKVDPEVFADYFGDLEMVEKVTKDKRDGKEIRTLFVKHKDGEKDVETEFGEYAKKAKPKLIPSLAPRREADFDLEDEYDPEDDDAPISRRPSLLPPADDELQPVGGLGKDEQRLIQASRGRYGR